MNKYQVRCFNETMETYSHNGPNLDLILVCHSLYYFYYDRQQLLRKLQSWLTDEGIMVVVVDTSPIIHALG